VEVQHRVAITNFLADIYLILGGKKIKEKEVFDLWLVKI
jgi:hypothetical protein